MLVPNLKGQDKEEQYINLTFLDQGGMGQVFKAFDSVNSIDVAIKLIPIVSKEEENLLSREIQVSQELSSDNLVKTYYCDKVTLNGTEYFYIVQYFYSNGNLRTRVQKDIPFEDCLSMILDLLNGLQVLHTKIIHRDLKPENILISDNNNLVITDFGLAKFIGEKTKTRSYKGSGTIPYMPPECWLNQENKIQMDIYSLGIIFYELLTGEFPFTGTTEEEWRDSHLFEPLPDIDKKRVGVSTKIKQVISKMTNKKATDRYSNVDEIISAIKESIKQSEDSNKAIERLASISHKKTEEVRTEQLKKEQENQIKREFSKLIDYHINELKGMVKAIVEDFNSRIEVNKINFSDRTKASYNQHDIFNISLDRIYATFEFFDLEAVDKYESDREDILRQYQIEKYGGIVSPIGESALKKRDIVYIGRVRTNYRSATLNECFGFNLLLVKGEDDLYGEWHIASFSDSALSRENRKDFGFELESFLKEFEKSLSSHTITVNYQKLNNDYLYRAIEEIII